MLFSPTETKVIALQYFPRFTADRIYPTAAAPVAHSIHKLNNASPISPQNHIKYPPRLPALPSISPFPKKTTKHLLRYRAQPNKGHLLLFSIKFKPENNAGGSAQRAPAAAGHTTSLTTYSSSGTANRSPRPGSAGEPRCPPPAGRPYRAGGRRWGQRRPHRARAEAVPAAAGDASRRSRPPHGEGRRRVPSPATVYRSR